MIFIGRRGVSGNVFFWLIVIVILLPLMIFSLNQILSSFSSSASNTHDIENFLVHDRIIHDISAIDPSTGRVLPYVIDQSKFSSDFLAYSLKTSRSFGARFSLDNQTIFFNEDFFDIAFALRNTNKYDGIYNEDIVILRNSSGDFSGILKSWIVFYGDK
jgi:hypothetical protein